MAAPTAALPPTEYPRRRQLFIGTALVGGAAAMFVLSAIGVYLAERAAAGDAWLADNTIPLTQPNVILFTLLMSAVTAQWATHALSRDDRAYTFVAVGMTLMFGLAVIIQAWFLYTQIELTVAQPEGGAFYALTGGHLAMVIGGLAFFALMGFRALGGSFSSRYPDGVAAATLFWHLTVALYLLVWLSVYVMK